MGTLRKMQYALTTWIKDLGSDGYVIQSKPWMAGKGGKRCGPVVVRSKRSAIQVARTLHGTVNAIPTVGADVLVFRRSDRSVVLSLRARRDALALAS